MSESIDIIILDNKIRNNLKDQNVDVYEKRLLELNKSLKSDQISDSKKEEMQIYKTKLSSYIEDIKNNVQYNFYILRTVHLLENYKKILEKPIKTSFLGKPIKECKEKTQIIDKFLNIIQEYINIDFDKKLKNNISCKNCKNKKDFDIIDNSIYICTNCYAEQTIVKHNSSYNDIDRVNISSKYMYDRKVHFRDCIKQYQGKQNSTIHQKVYDDLTIELDKHHLLIDCDDKKKRFTKVTKNHILMFLKELGYASHYENVHLIHYILTDVKPSDISHLEEKLLDDFDILTELYDKMYKNINRKNFINTQYVLYQLLRRHKYKCKKEEFIILKTIDRKFFHDEVCQKLFENLGWNNTPFY